MDYIEWEKKCAYLKDAYKAISQKYERLIDEVKTINHGGKYVLKIVYTDGKEHVQKFNSIFDAISEIKLNNTLGFRSYLKYEILPHRDI